MAKIGTAHIEIKPVVSDEALDDDLMQRIADAVAEGVQRGMARPVVNPEIHVHYPSSEVALGLGVMRSVREGLDK
jgi:hypothetical protein